MKIKRSLPQVGKLTLFKLRVGKVILGQTIGGFTAITPKLYTLILSKMSYTNSPSKYKTTLKPKTTSPFCHE